MSYFVIGVGGTGAKLMQTLVHLAAAGLLPEADLGRRLEGLLVDPDEANGNVDECNKLVKSYSRCSSLETGTTGPFRRAIHVNKQPWSPIPAESVDTLNEIFQYTQRQEHQPVESALLELMFSEQERAMKIHQGFRGRPAIGSVVLSHAIDFKDRNEPWYKLMEDARAAGTFRTGVPILLSGSIFGGSGAAGVPTILQLLRAPMREAVNNVRLGLMLFLPYFTFQQVPDEAVQADPNAFARATAEALKYYDERGFSEKADSIYLVGEQTPARMAVSAVGSAAQRNEPHFLELVAGFGALRFFSEATPRREEGEPGEVSLAARDSESTLTWKDLPTAEHQHDAQVARLQQMIEFAVAFRLNFYPVMKRELDSRDTKVPLLRHCVIDERVPTDDVQRDLASVFDYITRFLEWLLRISTPRDLHWTPGLVDINVFAHKDSAGEWQLRTEFLKDKDFRNLFVNAGGRRQPDLSAIWKRANEGRVDDPTAKNTGRLIRALYDACQP